MGQKKTNIRAAGSAIARAAGSAGLLLMMMMMAWGALAQTPSSAPGPAPAASSAVAAAVDAFDNRNALGWFLLVVAAVLIAIALLVPGQGFAFKRHWGGFGGSTSGWQASPSLVQLLVGLALASFGAMAILAGPVFVQGGTAAAPAAAAASSASSASSAAASAAAVAASAASAAATAGSHAGSAASAASGSARARPRRS